MSAHTPGPWAVFHDHSDPVTARTLAYICQASSHVAHTSDDLACVFAAGPDNPEREANARLIAAAPDLLALAQQYASECGNCNGKGAVGGWATAAGIEDWYETPCPECQDIRNVIERATRADGSGD